MTDFNELQNEKCYACKFCVWNEEYNQEMCEIKGCYENSKYIYFSLEERFKTDQN